MEKWNEIVGIYEGLNDNGILVDFKIGEETITVPKDSPLIFMIKESYRGKVIGVLCTDSPHKPFLVRTMEG
jgi:hypothetical protein